MKVAFIGFGGAGYGLGKGLKTAGVKEIYFYDENWNTPPFDALIRKRALEAGALLIQKEETLFENAKVINLR